jgi:hypothetical protein
VRTYKCWGCGGRGFSKDELVGHRCSSCRRERVELASGGGRFSPYTPQGSVVWKAGSKGLRSGYVFKKRKKRLSIGAAASAAEALRKRRQAPIGR